jgi:hypothetical protein
MSTISKIKFKEYIESFNFTNLFNDLGWNHLNEQTPIKLNEETYTFHSVAEKSGFRIMVFNPNASSLMLIVVCCFSSSCTSNKPPFK